MKTKVIMRTVISLFVSMCVELAAAAQQCYLFAYFKDNSTQGQQIWFAASTNGVDFAPLGESRPAIAGSAGRSGGLRDPHIMRAPDGSFRLVATDMDYSKGKWTARGILMAKSANLIDWDFATIHFPERYPGSKFAEADAVWAPQTILDNATGKLMVYFSLHSPKDGPFPRDAVYWAYANDSFTDLEGAPEPLFDYPDPTIDTDIVCDSSGQYHLFFNTWGKDGLRRRQYVFNDLHAPSGWHLMEDDAKPQGESVKSEGSSAWMLSDGTWILGYDCFANGTYRFCRSTDNLETFTLVKETERGADFAPRHGSVVTITDSELEALRIFFSTFYPVRDKTETTSLNGVWDFELDGRRGTINVPGNWETQGWKLPQYGCAVDDMTGVYSRTFQWNPHWEGRRVVLRFDGVLFGFEAKVNGIVVGRNAASAFNLTQLDITRELRKGENTLEVAVRSRADAWLFDTNDCWGMCGIFRDVEIFSVPSDAWIEDVTFTTKGTNWTAKVDIAGPKKDGVKASVALRTGGSIEMWTPSEPNLYDLVVTLEKGNGQIIQRVVERVGFRDIEVRKDGLYVNDERIFIKGVCWNETDPTEGRALSHETFFKNMAKMKEAGINAIRTAHYPFAPRFYDIADAMGFWIIDEVPFGSRGRELLANPDFKDELIARTEATIRRDKNHPSVLIWTCGNENAVTSNTIEVLKYAKAKDPTRPLALPMVGYNLVKWLESPAEHLDFDKYVDIYAGHYLSPRNMALVEARADKPVIETEFAHAFSLRKGFSLFEPTLETMRKRPDKWIGGCVWLWRDQAILTDGKTFSGYDMPEDAPRDAVRKFPKSKQGKRLDDGRLYDSCGEKGSDGIVFADLEPKPQFWRVKAAYKGE